MAEDPTYQLPRRSTGYVVMIRYAPGIWDFHPNRDAMFMTLPAAEIAAQQVPTTLETRIYRAKGGCLERVR